MATSKPRVVLNPAAVARILKSRDMASKLRRKADQIADAVDAQGLVASSGWVKTGAPAEIVGTVVESIDDDHATATVVIPHPAAKAMQATHGVMSKAASAAGVTPHQP